MDPEKAREATAEEVNKVLDALVGTHFIALVIKLTKASLGH